MQKTRWCFAWKSVLKADKYFKDIQSSSLSVWNMIVDKPMVDTKWNRLMESKGMIVLWGWDCQRNNRSMQRPHIKGMANWRNKLLPAILSSTLQSLRIISFEVRLYTSPDPHQKDCATMLHATHHFSNPGKCRSRIHYWIRCYIGMYSKMSWYY